MQYVPLGNIHDRVSRFGLGCMRLPQRTLPDGKKEIDEAEAIKLIRTAIDRGVNYIDTAYVYGDSEAVVGKALLDGYREKVLLITKFPMANITSRDQAEEFFAEELRRLQTDHIDIFHLHNLHKGHWRKVLDFGMLDFMRDLKERGVIKHIACSLHERIDHLEEVLDAFPWELVMVQYNYLDKFNQVGRKGVELIASRGIPMVAMEPLHGGLLAQDVPAEIDEAFGDFHPELNHAGKSFLWLHNQPEVSVILSGSSSIEQLEDSLSIFDKLPEMSLSEEDEQVYDRARAAWEKMVKVPCTDCKYCMPCPFGVNIPEVFRIYNETARSKNPQNWLYSAILVNSGEDVSKCVQCKQCEAKCPQFIEIAARLQEAQAVLQPQS